MATDRMTLKWKRPETVEYPKVWHTFMARDLNSDHLVEYRIEDVTQSNAEDVFEHMKAFYIRDEPAAKAFGKNKKLMNLFKNSNLSILIKGFLI